MTACKLVGKHVKESMETLKFEGDGVESPVKKKGEEEEENEVEGEGEEEEKYVEIARTKPQ